MENMRNIFICCMFLKILGVKSKCMYHLSDPYAAYQKIAVKWFERFTKIVKKQKIHENGALYPLLLEQIISGKKE